MHRLKLHPALFAIPVGVVIYKYSPPTNFYAQTAKLDNEKLNHASTHHDVKDSLVLNNAKLEPVQPVVKEVVESVPPVVKEVVESIPVTKETLESIPVTKKTLEPAKESLPAVTDANNASKDPVSNQSNLPESKTPVIPKESTPPVEPVVGNTTVSVKENEVKPPVSNEISTDVSKEPRVDTAKTSEIAVEQKTRSSLLHAKYLLIGGGTASYAALKAIQEKDKEADILLVSNEDCAPYMRPPLSKELWFSTDPNVQTNLKFKDWGGALRDTFYEELPNYKIIQTDDPEADIVESTGRPRLLLNSKVVDLDIDAKFCTLENGKRIKFEKVLLATGGTPRQLPFVNNLTPELKSKFSTFRTIEDFRKLESLAGQGKHIVVVGGGFLGSELAIALSKRGNDKGGIKVTQVFPESGNMGLVFPKYLMDWASKKIHKLGVVTIPNTQIDNAETKDSSVCLKLTNGSEILADHVVVAIGIDPNVELAKRAGLEIDEKRGGILVNAELEARTGVAGDTSSYHDVNLGRRRVEHHDHAILSGRFAGYNMTGQHKAYKHQSMFWSDLGPEIGYEAVGILDEKLKTVGVWTKATEKDSPKAAGSDNIRSAEPRNIKDSTETEEKLPEPKWYDKKVPVPENSNEFNDKYGKGIVFYTDENDKIVGVLMWNIFNRTAVASRIITEGKTVKDIQSLARLFKIYE